jgi:hypothetical protein
LYSLVGSGKRHQVDPFACLNNQAQLLQATNRLAEAERLMRRALLIRIEFTSLTGHKHPCLDTARANHRRLLEAMGETPDQIDQRLRELDNSLHADDSSA